MPPPRISCTVLSLLNSLSEQEPIRPRFLRIPIFSDPRMSEIDKNKTNPNRLKPKEEESKRK